MYFLLVFCGFLDRYISFYQFIYIISIEKILKISENNFETISVFYDI